MKFKGRVIFKPYIPKKKANVSASNFTKSVTSLVKSDMDVYVDKERQRIAQHLKATITTVTNMTRRTQGVDRVELFLPVRPDWSQQLHPFIFMYLKENVTQIFDSPLSVRCWLGSGMSHDHPGL